MSTLLAQQHIEIGAETHPRDGPQALRRVTAGSGSSVADEKNGKMPLSTSGEQLISGSRTLVDKTASASASTSVAQTRGHGPARLNPGKPALLMKDEVRLEHFQQSGAQTSNPSYHKELVTEVVNLKGLPVPFPKPAELQLESVVSKPTRAVIRHDSPPRVNSRRMSATNRRGFSAPYRADMLDCGPWTGQHPEDRLTESAIKGGHYEKAVVHNETNTARPSLWPHLKNGSGLQGLSALFAAVLQRKEANGRVIANSSFKPPPRVTLTDTKRETWLKDLSNPVVPLRRLSRTIPHGIRGKLLLDQCLAKNVPMARAVWLAKCVGANELRAFRRKGISGAVMIENEFRWVKEWTSIVESFNQECIDAKEHTDWKTRVAYTMQLTFRYYEGGLLDHDHFLDWLLSNIKHYTYDMLPIALLFLQNYWREVTHSLKHMRCVATICLERLGELHKLPENDLFSKVSQRLLRVISILLVTHPLSFLIPKSWTELSKILHIIGEDMACTTMRNAVRRLDRRNRKLNCIGLEDVAMILPRQQALISILDSVQPPYTFDRVCLQLLATKASIQEIVTTTFHWASSVYRAGQHRSYLAANVLRHFLSQNDILDDCVLTSLATLRATNNVDFRCLAHLVADLIRNQDMDAGHYLRWLIASGALNSQSTCLKSFSCDEQIIHDMPFQFLTPPLLSLRKMLLHSAGISDATSLAHTQAARRNIQQYNNPNNTNEDTKAHSLLPCSPQAIGFAGCFELSNEIACRITSLVDEHSSTTLTMETSSDLQEHAANSQIVRLWEALEALQDFRTMAEVFLAVLKSTGTLVLSILATSFEHNFETFYAVNPSSKLWTALVQRYRFLRLTGPPLRHVAGALLQTACRLKIADVVKYFENEVAMSEVSLAVAAYTPISDIQLETLQPSTIEADDDIDNLMATFTALDAKTINRVLEFTSTKTLPFEPTWGRDMNPLKPLFWKLRSNNEKLFDTLTLDWMCSRLTQWDIQSVGMVLSTILDAGCMSFSSFIRTIEEKCEAVSKTNEVDAAQFATAILELIAIDHEHDKYRLRQFSFCRKYPKALLRILGHTLQFLPGSGDSGIPNEHVKLIISDLEVLGAIHKMLLQNVNEFQSELHLSSLAHQMPGSANASFLITKLLDPNECLGLSALSLDEMINKLFETVDGFSLPCYQFALRFFSISPRIARSAELTTTYAILESVKLAISRDCVYWPRLISGLDNATKLEIRAFAEKSLFNAFNQSLETINIEQSSSPNVETLRRYLSVVEATASSIPCDGEVEGAKTLTKQVELIARLLESSTLNDDRSRDVARSAENKHGHGLPQHRVTILLHLILIHSRSFNTSEVKISLLTALSQLLIISNSFFTPETLEFLLDTTAYFSHDLSFSELGTIQNALGNLAQHSLLRYLFGFRQQSNCWLYLSNTHSMTSPSNLSTITFGSSAQDQHQSQTISQQSQQQHHASLMPYSLRHWELLSDSTPNIGANDTALNLRLFEARKV